MESICIEVLNEKGKTFYRPNTLLKVDIEVFIETFCNILELVNLENKKFTLMGDMNIYLLNLAHHDKTNGCINNIFSLGFLPCIAKPTRIANTSRN